MRRDVWILSVAVLCLTVSATAWAAYDPAEIEVEAIPPREINEGEVDTTKIRQSSSGLAVVGVGEQVYLKAHGGTGFTGARTYTWTLTTKPTGATAALTALKGDSLMTITPDVKGDYVVSLKVAATGKDTTVTRTLTAGTYIGAEACGQCHQAVKASWEKTDHATMLQRGLSGVLSAGYNAACVKCHSTGYNTANTFVTPGANDGFADRAAKAGWKFPNIRSGSWQQAPSGQAVKGDSLVAGGWKLELKGSAWDSLSADLKVMANIQCESCHGPGSEHRAGGLAGPPGARKVGKAFEVGVCARCHDDGHYHVRPFEWANAAHARATQAASGRVAESPSCLECHTGEGFITKQVKGQTPAIKDILEEVDITCAICHDPHSKANPKQVRFAGKVTLKGAMQGEEGIVEHTVEMGRAATCAKCHHLRVGQDKPGNRIHESHQSEMIFGMGGYHYPNETYPSGGHKHIDNVCVTCHMAIPARTDPRWKKLGSHTWRMYDDNGTPSDPKDDLYNTVGCEKCHGKIADFDVNGTQEEIEDMLKVLYDLLPKRKDQPTRVAWAYSATATTSATREMTPDEVNAAYNYLFVEQDLSEGVHNAPYARKLLADAIKSLRPKPTPGLVGDFNLDKRVDFEDLFLFIAAFGTTTASPNWEPRFDLSGNGAIGYVDWYMFLDNFGKTAAAGKPVYVDNGRNRMVGFDVGQTTLRSVDNTHFAVQVQVQNAADLRGYGVTLAYNPEELEFVRVLRSEGSLLKNDASAPASVTVLSNEPGRLVIASAITGNRTASGSGPLAEVVFQRKGSAFNPIVKVEAAQVSDGSFGMNRANGALAADEVPVKFVNALGQNFPNPFNPTTQITYSLAEEGRVHLVVYNLLGQVVRDLVDEYRTGGSHAIVWDGKDAHGRSVASGIYLYRIEANRFSAVRRMVLLK